MAEKYGILKVQKSNSYNVELTYQGSIKGAHLFMLPGRQDFIGKNVFGSYSLMSCTARIIVVLSSQRLMKHLVNTDRKQASNSVSWVHETITLQYVIQNWDVRMCTGFI